MTSGMGSGDAWPIGRASRVKVETNLAEAAGVIRIVSPVMCNRSPTAPVCSVGSRRLRENCRTGFVPYRPGDCLRRSPDVDQRDREIVRPPRRGMAVKRVLQFRRRADDIRRPCGEDRGEEGEKSKKGKTDHKTLFYQGRTRHVTTDNELSHRDSCRVKHGLEVGFCSVTSSWRGRASNPLVFVPCSV